MMKNIQYYLILIPTFFVISFLQGQKPIISQVSELYDIMTELRADEGSLNRFYFMYHTVERRERFKKLYDDYLLRLSGYNFDSLSQGGQVDYLLFDRDIRFKLKRLEKEGKIHHAIKYWLQPTNKLFPIESLRRRGFQQDWQNVATTINEINRELVIKTDELENSAPIFTTNESKQLDQSLQDIEKAWKHISSFYGGYDPLFDWWTSQPGLRLMTLLESYRTMISQKIDPSSQIDDDGSGITGTPIGRKALEELLAYEMIPYSPEELVDIANKEFAWCDRELLKASVEMGFGNDWRAAQEKVKQSYVPIGQQPQAMYELYEQSIDFLKKNDLLSIPPIAEESWRMTMLSPERQRIAPFFLGGEVLQIAYPTIDMTHEEKLMSMRGNNPHFNRATVHHELIAGHHLQQFVNRRNRTYRSFRTPFWTEGWALYWEMILWDMDFPRSAEDRIGMLFWRMHRCARIIFSLNYHMNQWTPQQCIDFLVDRVGHERANAEGEVRRSFTGGYGPLYQLAYKIGGLQFYALKKELVESGKMTYKEFHDAVMQENAMPVEMVRALLTNQVLTKDFQSQWRFYD